MKKRIQGQSLVEVSVFISLVGIVLLTSVSVLNDALGARITAHEQGQVLIEQMPLRDYFEHTEQTLDVFQEQYAYPIRADLSATVVRSDDYASARVLDSIWQLLGNRVQQRMPLQNQYELSFWVESQSESSWFKFIRLHDDWYPTTPEQLTSTPQAMVPSSYADIGPIRLVQDWVSLLPFTREFAPDSFRLGFVEDEIVPTHALEENQ